VAAATGHLRANLVLKDVENLVENWASDRVLFEARNIHEWRNWHKNGMQGHEPTRQNVLIIELMRSITERHCVTRSTHMATKDPKIIAFNLLRCDNDHTGSRAQATVNSLAYANSLRPDFWKDQDQPELADINSKLFNECLHKNKKRSDLLIADPSQMSGLLAFIMKPPKIFEKYLSVTLGTNMKMNKYFQATVENMQKMSAQIEKKEFEFICGVLIHPEMSSFKKELLFNLKKTRAFISSMAMQGREATKQIINAWAKKNELNAPTNDSKRRLLDNIVKEFKNKDYYFNNNVNDLLLYLKLKNL